MYLYEIVEKTNYFSYVNPENIVLFESDGSLVRFSDLDNLYLNENDDKGIALFLETSSNETFDRPRFRIDRNMRKFPFDSAYLRIRFTHNLLAPDIFLMSDEDSIMRDPQYRINSYNYVKEKCYIDFLSRLHQLYLLITQVNQ